MAASHDLVCQVCDQGFEASRRDARFCSGRCRLRSYRARSVSETALSVSRSVSEEPEEKPQSRVARDVAAAKRYLRAIGDLDD
jgi:hypothetical protein